MKNTYVNVKEDKTMLLPSIFGEDLFDRFFDMPVRTVARPENHNRELMKTDVKETENAFELLISLPGVKKENIQVELKEGYLTISANTKTENEEKDEKAHYIRRERYVGAASRTFYVGEDVTKEDIKAKYTDGVLTLNIPKVEAKPKVEEKHYISIEG